MAAKFDDYLGTADTGRVVLWYSQADIHAKPVPAVVMAGYENGVVDLNILHATGTQFRSSVYHMSNPGLRSRDTGQVTPGAMKNGAWAFCAHDAPKAEVPVEVPQEEGVKAEPKKRNAKAE